LQNCEHQAFFHKEKVGEVDRYRKLLTALHMMFVNEQVLMTHHSLWFHDPSFANDDRGATNDMFMFNLMKEVLGDQDLLQEEPTPNLLPWMIDDDKEVPLKGNNNAVLLSLARQELLA
jgi:hypothetical protein